MSRDNVDDLVLRMADLERKIKDYIVKKFLSDKKDILLYKDLSLIKQDINDLLGIFMLTGLFEEQFGIKIDEEEVVLENFATANAIKDLVIAKLSTKLPT